jgi:hypothetical protein
MNLRNPGNDFINDIREKIMPKQSLLSELWEFVRYRKRYWLFPIFLLLIFFGAMIVFIESSAIAPFIYALF